MRTFSSVLLLLSLVATASAGTIRVTVGNTGCRTKQLTVQRLWKVMPGTLSPAAIGVCTGPARRLGRCRVR